MFRPKLLKRVSTGLRMVLFIRASCESVKDMVLVFRLGLTELGMKVSGLITKRTEEEFSITLTEIYLMATGLSTRQMASELITM